MPLYRRISPLPFAVALLCHPAGAYGFIVVALGASAYACTTRSFVAAFTAASAAVLSALAFLHIEPSFSGLLLLALGVMLLQCELWFATYGTALVLGFATSLLGSWLVLAPAGATPVLSAEAKAALALAGSLALLATVLHGYRRRTLPRR